MPASEILPFRRGCPAGKDFECDYLLRLLAQLAQLKFRSCLAQLSLAKILRKFCLAAQLSLAFFWFLLSQLSLAKICQNFSLWPGYLILLVFKKIFFECFFFSCVDIYQVAPSSRVSRDFGFGGTGLTHQHPSTINNEFCCFKSALVIGRYISCRYRILTVHLDSNCSIIFDANKNAPFYQF